MMQSRCLVPGFALASAAVLLLAPLPRSWRTGWRSELLDLGHVPLFALVTGCLWIWLRPSLFRPTLIAIALAGVAEGVQHFTGRSASFIDFLYGTVGVLSAAVFIRVLILRKPWRIVLAAVPLLGPLLHSGPVLLDALEGSHDFPTLAHFRRDRELKRWETRQATLVREPIAHHAGRFSARITFLPGPDPYPSVVLTPVVRDFANYGWLCFELTVDGEPLELVISIRGGPDDSGHTSHYQVVHIVPHGDHVARVDLRVAAPRARPRPLDLADIWFVQLFVVKPDAPRSIRLRHIWLEP